MKIFNKVKYEVYGKTKCYLIYLKNNIGLIIYFNNKERYYHYYISEKKIIECNDIPFNYGKYGFWYKIKDIGRFYNILDFVKEDLINEKF